MKANLPACFLCSGRATFWLVIVCLAGLHPLVVSGQPSDEPLGARVAVDGGVWAFAENDQILYIGGLFTAAGPCIGGGAPVSSITGQTVPGFPKINGSVKQAINDGTDGLFVGGSFTKAGTLGRQNVAHLLSDGSVDPAWQASVSGGELNATVLVGRSLYIGGNFTNVNGQVRNRLAALNADSGELLAWNPNADSVVDALAAYNGVIYAGGAFANIGGASHPYLVGIDAATGVPTSWNPGVGGSFGATDDVLTLLVSNGRLFVGGYFTSLSGQTRSRLGSFDLTTGLLDIWDPNIGSVTIVQPTIFALAADGNTIYAGGTFTLVGSSNAVNLAAIDGSSGLALAWDPRVDPIVSSGFPTGDVLSLGVYNGLLYVGGNLAHIGGQTRGYAASLDLLTGDATDWDPRPNMNVLTFAPLGGNLFIGGFFSSLGTVPRSNVAAYDLRSHQITSWNPGVQAASGNIAVNALLIASNQVFIGGIFTNVGGVARKNLAAVDLNAGAVLDWAPEPNFQVYTLATWNDRLYVGGTFTNIAGMDRMNVAEFDLNSGALTDWDAGLSRGLVKTLLVAGDTLYIGGLIRSSFGQTHHGLVTFDLTTGGLNSWDAGIGGNDVESVAVVGTRLYVGGRFNTAGGMNRTNYFGIDTATSQILPAADAGDVVYCVTAVSNLVVLTGNFQSIAGQQRSYLAALNPDTGTVTSWNPNPDLFAQTVTIIGDTLYVGGAFVRLAGETSRGVSAFALSQSEPPTILAGSFTRLADGSVQFGFTAPGALQVTIQSSTDLLQWTTLQTVPVANGSGVFTDSQAGLYAARYYRVSVP